MLFWHGQPDHYWSGPGDMYPLPSSGVLRYPPNPPKSAAFGETEAWPSTHPFRGVFSRRDPPVLPYLKQEEPNGISTSQPPVPAFQYVLCAPTSPAVRHHEETLTYLNQGESGGAGEEGPPPPPLRAQLPLPAPSPRAVVRDPHDGNAPRGPRRGPEDGQGERGGDPRGAGEPRGKALG